MMKRLLVFFVSCLVWCAANAASCEEDMAAQLEQTWKEYYTSALVKDGKDMEKYFNFPLRLLGPYDDDKPTLINKKFFLKNYSLIFIKNKVTKNTVFFVDFPKWKNETLVKDDIWRMGRFCDKNNPNPPTVRFGDIIFKLFPKSGWKIADIFYSPDDKDYLFSSVNPDMEYAFP